MLKPPFANNEIYHIYNRGVEKRTIFLKGRDYQRFLDGIYLFNTPMPVRLDQREDIEAEINENNKNPLVEVLSFCLMPNHFHLLLRQRKENGIPLFMQKLCTGYTMYFNKVNDRVGSLFQNKFKAVRIVTDEHLFCIPHYIHLNPLEIMGININKKTDIDSVVKRLENYPGSSLSDFMGQSRHLGIAGSVFVKEFFQDHIGYRGKLIEWIKDMRTEDMSEVGLDYDTNLTRSDLT